MDKILRNIRIFYVISETKYCAISEFSTLYPRQNFAQYPNFVRYIRDKILGNIGILYVICEVTDVCLQAVLEELLHRHRRAHLRGGQSRHAQVGGVGHRVFRHPQRGEVGQRASARVRKQTGSSRFASIFLSCLPTQSET